MQQCGQYDAREYPPRTAEVNKSVKSLSGPGFVSGMNGQLQDLCAYAQQLAQRANRCADKLFGPEPCDLPTPSTDKGLIERAPAETELMQHTVAAIRTELYALDKELQRLETL